MTSFEASGGQKNGTWDEASLAMTIAAMDLNPECGNGVVEFPERCDAGENNGVPKLGGWCTSKCELAQCGDGKIEPPESCECLTGWSLKAAKDDAQEKFTTLCPSSFARSDGSELALGWVCSSKCSVITPPESFMSPRKNKHYLPEFICTRPKRADGTFRPECIPTNVDYKADGVPAPPGTTEANPAAPLMAPGSESGQ